MQPHSSNNVILVAQSLQRNVGFLALLSELSRQLHSWTFLGIKAFPRSSELSFRKSQLTSQEQTCSRINQFFYVSFPFTFSSSLSIKSTLSRTWKISNSGQTVEKQDYSFSFPLWFSSLWFSALYQAPTVEHECEWMKKQHHWSK